jgi:hypothetical protein
MAIAVLRNDLGVCVYKSAGDNAVVLEHCTMDESQMMQVGKASILKVMKNDTATHVLMVMGSAQAAAGQILKMAPLMKGPVQRQREDVN